MAEEEEEERREDVRQLTDLDVVLSEPGGAVVEPDGRAVDISPDGFKLVTRAQLKRGQRLRFVLKMEDGAPIDGEVELAWAKDDGWGGCESGAKVINISWSDARRLRSRVYAPGYDFSRWAWLAAKGVFVLVLVLGLHQVMANEPHLRSALLNALPAIVIVVAAVAVVASLFRG